MNISKIKPKIFTWHTHGSYLYYLTQANCDFYVPVDTSGRPGYGGKSTAYQWGNNIHEVPTQEIKNIDFDCIVYQSKVQYEIDRHFIFSKAQQALPQIYLEHDPPREHPTDTRHIIQIPNVLVVHVTEFNKLMWDNGIARAIVIDHGVTVPHQILYRGTIPRGIVVINNIKSRGRRVGLDIFEEIKSKIPLDLIGMNSVESGGIGEIPHHKLAEYISQYRFYFSPIRYTSLALSTIEAMMVGLPVVGLATTELVSVIRNNISGYISLNTDDLLNYMKILLDQPELAKNLGKASQKTANERFSISRFTKDWESVFQAVIQRKETDTILPHMFNRHQKFVFGGDAV